MGIRDRSFFAVPLLAVLFLVVGCSSSEPQVVDESKYEDLYDDDADSGDDADSVDDSEGFNDEDFPDPPELPDAVKDESEDGAIAAVEYFFEAYTYAFQTSDTAAFSEIVTDDCSPCGEIIDAFEERSEQDSYARTDGYSNPEVLLREDQGEHYVIHVKIDFDGEVLVTGDHEEKLLDDVTYSVILALDFGDDRWLIRKINAEKIDE